MMLLIYDTIVVNDATGLLVFLGLTHGWSMVAAASGGPWRMQATYF